MATYPLPTIAAQLTSSGVVYPSYQDTLLSLQASFQNIYGSDIYITPDSQDGQWLAYLAQLVYDQNQAIEAAYLNFDPTYAQGAGLSSLVKINGLTRGVSSNSTVTLLLGGAVGTTITNGQANDATGNVWNLPASVLIDGTGTATVTATCATAGAVAAAAGTITQIKTPTLGWATVTNPTPATLGSAVETDPALRTRQTRSTSLPAQTVLAGIVAAVQNVAGVTECIGYENDTNTTDANGLPAHTSAALVVMGGDNTAVATAINLKKTPGNSTYGNTAVTITDLNGAPKTINFYRPTTNALKATITVKALQGYTSTVTTQIQQALSSYIAALLTGATVYYSRLYFPAQLNGTGQWQTYEVQSLQIGLLSGSVGTSDITQAIYQNAVLDVADIVITVV